jgi:hypothetical protein
MKNEKRPFNNLKKDPYAPWRFIFILFLNLSIGQSVLSRGILIVS